MKFSIKGFFSKCDQTRSFLRILVAGINALFHTENDNSLQKQPLEVFYKKGVHKNFAKFSQACNFPKKESLAQAFSCEFCDIFKYAFFVEHL